VLVEFFFLTYYYNKDWFLTHNFRIQAIDGVPKIKDGYNPATWMLEVSSLAVETRLGIHFADIYRNSDLYQLSIWSTITASCIELLFSWSNFRWNLPWNMSNIGFIQCCKLSILHDSVIFFWIFKKNGFDS